MMKRAKLILTSGKANDIVPKNGTDFDLKEMQQAVDGYIQILSPLGTEPEELKGTILIINEEGKLNGLEVNNVATLILWQYGYSQSDFIVGNAILCDSNMVK